MLDAALREFNSALVHSDKPVEEKLDILHRHVDSMGEIIREHNYWVIKLDPHLSDEEKEEIFDRGIIAQRPKGMEVAYA